MEKCKSLLEDPLDKNVNDVKRLLGQLFIILHNKGCDISRKVSEIYESFSPLDQLRFILTLLEDHFWMFPPMHEVWNDLQDSHEGNFDENPFQGCNCSSSTANEAMRIKGPHTIEIECENCPYNLERDSNTKAVIKITCACRDGTGEHCYMTLLERLDTRLYRHVNDTSDNSYHEMFLTMKSCSNEDEDTVESRKKISLIDFATKPTIPGAAKECTPIPFLLGQDASPSFPQLGYL